MVTEVIARPARGRGELVRAGRTRAEGDRDGAVGGTGSPKASSSWTVIGPKVALLDAVPDRAVETKPIFVAVAGITLKLAPEVGNTLGSSPPLRSCKGQPGRAHAAV